MVWVVQSNEKETFKLDELLKFCKENGSDFIVIFIKEEMSHFFRNFCCCCGNWPGLHLFRAELKKKEKGIVYLEKGMV